jgi:hypothetical protein
MRRGQKIHTPQRIIPEISGLKRALDDLSPLKVILQRWMK